jgi:hypothetical protein
MSRSSSPHDRIGLEPVVLPGSPLKGCRKFAIPHVVTKAHDGLGGSLAVTESDAGSD